MSQLYLLWTSPEVSWHALALVPWNTLPSLCTYFKVTGSSPLLQMLSGAGNSTLLMPGLNEMLLHARCSSLAGKRLKVNCTSYFISLINGMLRDKKKKTHQGPVVQQCIPFCDWPDVKRQLDIQQLYLVHDSLVSRASYALLVSKNAIPAQDRWAVFRETWNLKMEWKSNARVRVVVSNSNGRPCNSMPLYILMVLYSRSHSGCL